MQNGRLKVLPWKIGSFLDEEQRTMMNETAFRRLSAAGLCAPGRPGRPSAGDGRCHRHPRDRRAAHEFRRRLALLQGRSRRRRAARLPRSAWTELRLPHDWAIEGPFDSTANPHTGALPIFGTGWYRKTLHRCPTSAKGKYFSIEFDGAMSNARVWLNGQELGGRPYGYIGFAFDLTPYLNFGAKENVLAVRLTPEDHSSRWYPGAGIYRNVWLDVTGPVHVAHWGTYVTTPEVTDDRATVAVKTEVRNRDAARTPRVTLADLHPGCRRQSGGRSRQRRHRARPAARQTVAAKLDVSQVRSAGTSTAPICTALVSEVKDGNRVVDRYVTPFGIRTIAFDKQKGFLLNGRHVKMQGVCDHHDLGALGAAVNRRATERQLQIMKARGRQRHPHQPQSAVARTAGTLRPPGAGGDGRILRHVAHSQSDERLQQVFRRVERARRARLGAPRPQPSRASSCGASATRSPSRSSAEGWRDGQAPDRLLPPGGSHAAHHLGIQQPGGRHQEPPGRRTSMFPASTTGPGTTSRS